MTTKVYGCSDDLVEVEADNSFDEYPCFQKDVRVTFDDGTVIRIGYSKPGMGVWWIDVEKQGTAQQKLTVCEDEDADPYSDVFEIDANIVSHRVIKRKTKRVEIPPAEEKKPDEELLHRSLPKWPQMIVTGKTLDEEQALEIIRRTDRFFACPIGNNHDFVEEAKKIVRYPDGGYDDVIKWEKRWGYIPLGYVENDWISSAFIYGANGWCHPDGTIGFALNIGKWPEVWEVLEDWKRLAQAFPFLEVEATLMSNEHHCPSEPVVSFLVRNGTVELVDPKLRNIHTEAFRIMPSDTATTMNMMKAFDPDYHGEISLKQIQKWAAAVFKTNKK